MPEGWRDTANVRDERSLLSRSQHGNHESQFQNTGKTICTEAARLSMRIDYCMSVRENKHTHKHILTIYMKYAVNKVNSFRKYNIGKLISDV